MINYRKLTFEKLEDKGFDWIDIHYFMMINNLNLIYVPHPPDMNYIWGLPIGVEPEEQKRRWDEHYKEQIEIENLKWYEAYIAADYERYR